MISKAVKMTLPNNLIRVYICNEFVNHNKTPIIFIKVTLFSFTKLVSDSKHADFIAIICPYKCKEYCHQQTTIDECGEQIIRREGERFFVFLV
jgi:hypothetical protein